LPIREVISVLSKVTKPTIKSQFETTAEYKARIDRALSQPVLGKITSKDLIGFTLSDKDVTSTYDADKGTLSVAISLESVLGDVLPNEHWRKSLLIDRDTKFLGYSMGRNAFNVRVRISNYTAEKYYLAIDDMRPFTRKTYYASGPINIPIPLDSNFARQLSGNLRVLAVGELQSPWTDCVHGGNEDDVSIHNPVEIANTYCFLHFKLQQLWVYHLTSGRILTKYLPVTIESPTVTLPLLPTAPSQPVVKKVEPIDYTSTFSAKDVDEKAKIISRPLPTYTKEAQKNQITGTVTLRAVFSSSGQGTWSDPRQGRNRFSLRRCQRRVDGIISGYDPSGRRGGNRSHNRGTGGQGSVPRECQ